MKEMGDVKHAVWEIFLDGTGGAKKIKEQLKAKGVLEDVDDISDRSIYRWCSEARERYSEEQRALDEPFTLRPDLPSGVIREDSPILFSILHYLYEYPQYAGPRGLTIRAARWVSLLHQIMINDGLHELWTTANTYANVERWAVIEGRQIGSRGLDAMVAYRRWQSNNHRVAWRAAVASGRAPGLEWHESIASFSMDPDSIIRQQMQELKAMEVAIDSIHKMLSGHRWSIANTARTKAEFMGIGIEELADALAECSVRDPYNFGDPEGPDIWLICPGPSRSAIWVRCGVDPEGDLIVTDIEISREPGKDEFAETDAIKERAW